MSEIKPEAIRVREKREQQARLAVKLSLIKNKTRRDWKLMRWYRGQPGAEDPGDTAQRFARRIEERSDRKAPVFTAKLFAKIKKQRASSVSKITVFCRLQPQEKSTPAPPGFSSATQHIQRRGTPRTLSGTFPRRNSYGHYIAARSPETLSFPPHGSASSADGRMDGSGGSGKALAWPGRQGASVGSRGRGRGHRELACHVPPDYAARHRRP